MSDHQLEVGRSKLPMSAYDLMGYIIPGATLLTSAFLFEFEPREQLHIKIVAPLYSSLYNLWPDMSGSHGHWILGVVFFVLLVAVAYVCGHLVSSVSSFLIDRIFIYKGYGYPYEQLLGIAKPSHMAGDSSRAFYRGTCLWLNLYFVLRVGHLLWPHRVPLVAAYAVGYYTLLIVSVRLLSFFSHRPGYQKLFRWLSFWSVHIHAAPYEAIARPLSRILGTKAAFPSAFTERYESLFKGRFGITMAEAGTGNFWLCYAHVLTASPTLGSLLSNWFRLYSFARNLSMAFYLSFIYVFATFSFQRGFFQNGVPSALSAICASYLALSGIFLVRYVYLYVSYFTKFTFRAFVVTESGANAASAVQATQSPLPAASTA